MDRLGEHPRSELPFLGESGLATKMARGGELMPSLLGLTPHALYSLPYRQLCGQLAARVSAELGGRESAPPNLLTATLAAVHKEPLDLPPPSAFSSIADSSQRSAEKALAFIDALQIDLANLVNARAAMFSMVTLLFLFVALVGPVAGRVAPLGDTSGFLAHYIGRLAALCIAAVILVLFGIGSLIIASLTFRWIDRVASAR